MSSSTGDLRAAVERDALAAQDAVDAARRELAAIASPLDRRAHLVKIQRLQGEADRALLALFSVDAPRVNGR